MTVIPVSRPIGRRMLFPGMTNSGSVNMKRYLPETRQQKQADQGETLADSGIARQFPARKSPFLIPAQREA